MSAKDVSNGVMEIVDAFYTSYVLRDFVGRVIPGFVLFWLISFSVNSEKFNIPFVAGHPVMGVIVVCASAWITTISLLQLTLEVLLNRFSNIKQDEMLDIANRFRRVSASIDRVRVERYVIIKEACGQTFSAIVLSATIWLFVNVVKFAVSRENELYFLVTEDGVIIIFIGGLFAFSCGRKYLDYWDAQVNVMKAAIAAQDTDVKKKSDTEIGTGT